MVVRPRGSKMRASCWSSFSQRRSEEHTSELQSPCNLVCRLLLEKKKNKRSSYVYLTEYQTVNPRIAFSSLIYVMTVNTYILASLFLASSCMSTQTYNSTIRFIRPIIRRDRMLRKCTRLRLQIELFRFATRNRHITGLGY